jgi:hypothetical protein
MQTELAHDIAAMSFHGLGAQVQEYGHFLRTFAFGKSCVTSRSRAFSVGKSGGSFRLMACPFSRKPASTKSITRGVKSIRLLCKASTAATRSRAAVRVEL